VSPSSMKFMRTMLSTRELMWNTPIPDGFPGPGNSCERIHPNLDSGRTILRRPCASQERRSLRRSCCSRSRTMESFLDRARSAA
jgi:hypothetical protein